jgi:3-oxoacyl-[acyl-carrier protein] reductase
MPGKNVLVTGSSRGIGRAIALRLAQDGWNVAIHYSGSEKEANDVAQEIDGAATLEQLARNVPAGEGQTGGCLGTYQADLYDPEQAVSLVNKVIGDHGLDAVVNNAGVYRQTSFLIDTEEDVENEFADTANVNWHSPRRIVFHACRHFAKKGGGKVLNIVSRVAHRGEAHASSYSSSKAALLNLTRALAVEMADRNIQHFAIAPGWVETAMVRKDMDKRLPEILSTIPLGRMATPEDCAGAAAYLLSDEAAYLSGIVIDINGASYLR